MHVGVAASCALTALAACTAFGGSDGSTVPDVDAGISDASTQTSNDGTSNDDGSALSGDAADPVTTKDSSPNLGTYCAGISPSLFCDDFDTFGRDAGWTGTILTMNSTLTTTPAFMSPPNALDVIATSDGTAFGITPTMMYAGLPFSVRFDFKVSLGASSETTILFADFGIGGGLQSIVTTGPNGDTHCLKNVATFNGSGPHSVEIRFDPKSPTGGINCWFDQPRGGNNTSPFAVGSAPVGAQTIQFQIGAQGQKGGMRLAIDEVLIAEAP